MGAMGIFSLEFPANFRRFWVCGKNAEGKELNGRVRMRPREGVRDIKYKYSFATCDQLRFRNVNIQLNKQ